MNAKTSASYWVSRVYFHDTTAKFADRFYSVKIQFEKRRERFSLATANKEIAASTAAEIYRTIQSDGWTQAILVYKKGFIDSAATPSAGITIGKYLQAVRDGWDGKETTFNLYVRALRKIVSEIHNLDPENQRLRFMISEANEWHSRIDQVPLSAITDDLVNKWKMAFFAAAMPTETARNKRKISINTYLRNARSLFAKRVIKATGLEIPSPLPFAGVEFFGGVDQKYFSTFDIGELLATAGNQLAQLDPDAYSVVLLAAFTGLRRREIDLLEWPSIEFDRQAIQLRITDFFSPKTPDSLRSIPLRNPDVLDWFRERKRLHDSDQGFVIAPGTPYVKDERMDYYRCEHLFERVVRWLRVHGVKEVRALHALRKEAGSDIVGHSGLVSGAKFLRHKTTAVTAQHYTDSHITETPSFSVSRTSGKNVILFRNSKES